MDEDQKKCGGISLVGIIAILVSLACIIIGAINIDFDQTEFTDQDIISTCKAQTKIPFYLVVAGVLNIMLMVLRLIFQVRFFPISNWIIMTFLKCLIVSIETKWCHCFYWNKMYAQCLKITQNVAFEFLILAFSTNFFPIKSDLSGNTVWPQASDFQKLAKMDHLRHF